MRELRKKINNITQGNIQEETSMNSTKVYFMINIQNKDRDFSFSEQTNCTSIGFYFGPEFSNNWSITYLQLAV